MYQVETQSESSAQKTPAPAGSGSYIPVWLLDILLGLGTLATFWPALHCNFITYDDPEYVTSNVHTQKGLTLEGVKWAFTHVVTANWHPLTLLSHMLDCQMFGLQPWGHHLTSVLLHTLNTVLVFVLLLRMTGAAGRSLLVAALFGLHPLRVESVAWISERKDVLSAFFGLLTLIFYVSYARKREKISVREGSRRREEADTSHEHAPNHPPRYLGGYKVAYGLALVCFALGLMSKAMLVTWPFVMLLLDFWPLGRSAKCEVRSVKADADGLSTISYQPSTISQLVWEKIPFLALAAASCVVTFAAQRHAGAVVANGGIPLGARGENALISYCRYMGKMAWPVDFAVLYPHPGYWPVEQVVLAGLLLAGISMLVWVTRREYPFLLVGWLWYCGTLVPVIGLVQVGIQSMADRYTYLPSLGLLILAVWGGYELARGRRYLLIPMAAAGTVAVLVCSGLTRHQLGYWRDSVALFRHTLEVTRDNSYAHNALGFALWQKGHLDESLGEFREAIRISPNFDDGHYNLGVGLFQQGRIDEAIPEFQAALRLNPVYTGAHNNLGCAFDKEGRTDDAIAEFQEVLREDPDNDYASKNLSNALARKNAMEKASAQKTDDGDAHYRLGIAMDAKGQTDEAIRQYQEALTFKPGNAADIRHMLGVDLGKEGRTDEAIRQLQEAVRLKPEDAEVHNDLGNALNSAGRTDDAIGQYQEAIRLKPDDAGAHSNLGGALGNKGDIDGAIIQLREAARLNPNDPLTHYDLALTFDAKGNTNEAIVQLQEALRLKPDFAEARSQLDSALQTTNAVK